MIGMRLDEVAAAVDGRLAGADPAAVVTGAVEYDSRKVTPGGLFVAFPGEHVDGHDYAAAAVAAGATAVLGTRPVEGVPMVLVDDALAAMAGLARAALSRLPDLCVIGLTGSSGKTTTKDMVAQLAARLGPTVAPAGSLNNELGFPYTVLKADGQTRYLVLEMGARGMGHISYLAGIARPRVGVVLNVGTSHIGEFGSVDNIATAKGELAEAVPVDGVAILNADDERVRKMAVRTRGRVVLVGEAPDADVRADDVTVDGRGRASYTLRVARGSVPVRLRVPGRHQVGNSLAAAAVARELGMPLRELGEALGELELRSARRMDVFERSGGVTVIDDSYNANPASMAAALRALATMGEGRRTVAVLGYMAELGEFERSGHEEVGRLAAELGVDRLVVVGETARPIHDGATAHPGWEGRSVVVGDQEAAIDALRAELRPGDVVLVKGSRYRTWDVVDALRPEGSVA
jgi:UDP-N-acetylmuramoyl-tripeptide--D-alanyl-D-alanine ligase